MHTIETGEKGIVLIEASGSLSKRTTTSSSRSSRASPGARAGAHADRARRLPWMGIYLLVVEAARLGHEEPRAPHSPLNL